MKFLVRVRNLKEKHADRCPEPHALVGFARRRRLAAEEEVSNSVQHKGWLSPRAPDEKPSGTQPQDCAGGLRQLNETHLI
ncbi:MAG TPA: hypothetical protein VE093_35620 [Polyangiaceae bacterium]|nr:hypothetical protein [Polyangiaceae bacterium]